MEKKNNKDKKSIYDYYELFAKRISVAEHFAQQISKIDRPLTENDKKLMSAVFGIFSEYFSCLKTDCIDTKALLERKTFVNNMLTLIVPILIRGDSGDIIQLAEDIKKAGNVTDFDVDTSEWSSYFTKEDN